MAKNIRLCSAVLCFVALAADSLAAPPDRGLLYNKRETGSLTYFCTPNGEYLDCDFVQISIRRKASPGNLAKELEDARKQFAGFTKDGLQKECAGTRDMASALRTGAVPKGADAKVFREGMASMTKLQKKDLFKIVDASEKFCEAPIEDNFLAITRLSHDKDIRTCSVNSNAFKQRFKQVDQSETWVVVQDSPSGPCGFVNVSRFETDKDVSFKIPFWKYFAKKVVTNKSGEAFPGMSCSAFDESEYEYDWRSKEAQLSCDYITFSVF